MKQSESSETYIAKYTTNTDPWSLGFTRSGKNIHHAFVDEDKFNPDYTSQDHLDAAKAMEDTRDEYVPTQLLYNRFNKFAYLHKKKAEKLNEK